MCHKTPNIHDARLFSSIKIAIKIELWVNFDGFLILNKCLY